jgi:hypothetical protein
MKGRLVSSGRFKVIAVRAAGLLVGVVVMRGMVGVLGLCPDWLPDLPGELRSGQAPRVREG